MRRWQLCIALILTSVMSAPAAEAAGPTEDGPPIIVSGVLADAADRPVPGDVELFAWPTGRPIQIGEIAKLVPLGYVRAGRDGRFTVRADATPELNKLANLNGGYVNLELRALAGGVIHEAEFSRFLDEERFSAQEARPGKTGRNVEWRAAPDEPAEPIRVNLGQSPGPQGDPSSNRISPMQGGCSGMKLIESQVGETVIGELRTPPDTVKATFLYGKRADSEISVAARAAKGPWEVSGSHHIGNAQRGAMWQNAAGGQHVVVRTRFIYDKYEYHCAIGRREKVVPREWMGDGMSESVPERGCMHADEKRLGRYGRDGGFIRDKERAVTWNGAVSVFGASMSARSGYSESVTASWEFGGQSLHLLCGDDGPPWRSRHVFAGFSA
jgi:hypothetical protein